MHPHYWASPETIAVNRLPMLNIEHFEKLSLDGVWRFQLLAKPTDAPRKRWIKVPVPSLWTSLAESHGIADSVLSTDGSAPFDLVAPEVPLANPTGVYERDFEIPGSWQSKRVVLQLGGTESAAKISINGELVGIAKDPRLHSDFDITSLLRIGKNIIRIEVTRWSDGTYLENIDGSWHGGIARSIKLYATSKVFIERLYTRAGLARDFTTGTLQIEATIGAIDGKSPVGYTFRASVEELSKKKGGSLSASIEQSGEPLSLESTIAKISPWSDENPSLYTLNFELIDPQGAVVQISSQRIGFRSISQKTTGLSINGKAVALRGANRSMGAVVINRAATRDEVRAQLLALKRQHFNAIYSSHFVGDSASLDLCDELGIFVVDQANIYPLPSSNVVNDVRYLAPILDRTSRLVQRDLHHPSVILWSLGECDQSGINCKTAFTYLELMDSSRPVLECDETAVDFDTPTAPLIISQKKGSSVFEAVNTQKFTSSADFEVRWRILENEFEVDQGRCTVPVLAPNKSAVLKINSTLLRKSSRKTKPVIRFSLVRKGGTAWSSPLSEIATFTFTLKNKNR